MSFDINVYKKPLQYGQYTLTNEEYGKLKALNYSSIKECDKGEEYVEYATNSEYRLKSKALDFGNAFHCYLYEPDKFEKTFFFSDFHADGRKKADKEKVSNELVWKHPGKIRIDLYEGEIIKKMVDAIHVNPWARALVEMPGKCESTLLWKHPVYELNFKSRFDKLPEKDYIIDLKTTKGSYKRSFEKDFYGYGYNVQAALYSDAYEALFDEKRDYVIIAISKDEPFSAKIYNITEETREKARRVYHRYLDQLIEYSNNPNIIHEPIDL